MSSILRKDILAGRYVTSAAASGWVGGEVTIGNQELELILLEISVPAGVDYALPCYLEWGYHYGQQDEDIFELGHGSTKYRAPFVIRGPIRVDGPGKILSAVYHHSTSHVHTVKALYRVVGRDYLVV